jgi:acyl-CoA thioester hydrolase
MLTPRYAEIDQQGIVFNAHYLTWFDEATTAFLEARGTPMAGLLASGTDLRLVRSVIEWVRPVSAHDRSVQIVVRPGWLRNSSFSLRFEVTTPTDGQSTCTSEIVYVCVSTETNRSTAAPREIRELFGSADKGRQTSHLGTAGDDTPKEAHA